MVRAPCCEKMGLKRGPWTAEEDKILVAFIRNYGHGNWRALPKQAGLLRCGKSCRLRWTNYLRPDIKRGNFSHEEEETIIKLHELLGNRWSAIAARLPGRTDNEIKNVWHTNLKKRLNKNDTTAQETKRKPRKKNSKSEIVNLSESVPESCSPTSVIEVSSNSTGSPQQSSSESTTGTDLSSVVSTGDNHDMGANKDEYNESAMTNTEHDVPFNNSIDIEGDFWMDESLYANLNMLEDFPASTGTDPHAAQPSFSSDSSIVDDGMDFWFDLFMKAEDEPVLPADL